MRFKTLAAVGFILLGIVTFSVYSGSSNERAQDEGDIIQNTEISNKTGDNSIFEEIKIDSSLIEAPESCEHFETIIVNPAKFRELATNGTVNLTLMGEDYELKLQERETGKPKNVTSYMGYIVGKPQSSAFFTVKNDSIEGCINVDFYTLSYGIASTNEKYSGKIVHLLWRCYSEGGEEIKKHHSLDPLEFSLKNSDKKSHEIQIELFDFYNKSIFKENYTVDPGDEIFSSEIKVEPGYYRYKIILDNRSTFEQRVTANYAANLGGSEKLHLTISDDPNNPVEFVSEIA